MKIVCLFSWRRLSKVRPLRHVCCPAPLCLLLLLCQGKAAWNQQPQGCRSPPNLPPPHHCVYLKTATVPLEILRFIFDKRCCTMVWLFVVVCLISSSLSLIVLLLLQVTRVLMARFLQRSKRNLTLSSEHAGNTGQGPKRRSGAEGAATNHLALEQVWQQLLIILIHPPYLKFTRIVNTSE